MKTLLKFLILSHILHFQKKNTLQGWKPVIIPRVNYLNFHFFHAILGLFLALFGYLLTIFWLYFEDFFATVRFTSMNPRLFIKTFLLIFWGSTVFELQTNPIPTFESSLQELSHWHIRFLLQPTQQLKYDKTWFWAIY